MIRKRKARIVLWREDFTDKKTWLDIVRILGYENKEAIEECGHVVLSVSDASLRVGDRIGLDTE